MENKQNPYITLGYTMKELTNMESPPTVEQIKKMYRQASLKAHPDRLSGSTDAMQELNEAFEALMAGEVERVMLLEEVAIKDNEALKIALRIFNETLNRVSVRSTADVFVECRTIVGEAISSLMYEKHQCNLNRKRLKHMSDRLDVTGVGSIFFKYSLLSLRVDNCEKWVSLRKQLACMESVNEIFVGKSLIPRKIIIPSELLLD